MKKSDAVILIVEPEKVQHSVFKRQLELLGYGPADFARDGAAAAVFATKSQYNFVLISDHFGAADFVATARLIKNAQVNSGFKQPPVVVSAAHFSPSRTAPVDVNDFMPAPVLLTQFDEMLMKWLPLDHEQCSLENWTTRSLDAETFKLAESGVRLTDLHNRIAKLRNDGKTK